MSLSIVITVMTVADTDGDRSVQTVLRLLRGAFYSVAINSSVPALYISVSNVLCSGGLRGRPWPAAPQQLLSYRQNFISFYSCITPALLWYRPDNHQKEHEEVFLINLASVAEFKRPDSAPLG